MGCAHRKEARRLDSGYDVVCDSCGEIVGRVALFPSAVLTPEEAAALLEGGDGYQFREAIKKLEWAKARWKVLTVDA